MPSPLVDLGLVILDIVQTDGRLTSSERVERITRDLTAIDRVEGEDRVDRLVRVKRMVAFFADLRRRADSEGQQIPCGDDIFLMLNLAVDRLQEPQAPNRAPASSVSMAVFTTDGALEKILEWLDGVVQRAFKDLGLTRVGDHVF